VKPSSRLVLLGAGLLATLSAGSARAATQDAAAQELADQAIFTDYLQLDFASGEKKLKKAIALCETGTCSPTVTAQVYRDLAVIYITGMKRSQPGHDLLVKALRLDSSLALDADLTTPELVRVFNAAKGEVAREAADRKAAGAAVASSAAPSPTEPEPKKALQPKTAPAAEHSAAKAGAAAGSLAEPSASGSVDCPPDFPGCEPVNDEPAKSEPAEPAADLGVRNWLSAALQQDFLMFSTGSGVCGPDRPAELSCFRAGDSYRPGTADNTAGSGGSVAGGFRIATTRLLIGYDRILFPNIGVGLRIGYAVGGGPAEPDGAAFVPIHAELRGTYWFGGIQPGKLRPYATLGGGVAQVDSSVTTQVVDRCPSTSQDPPCTEGQIALSRVTVWKKTGTTFASLGGGALFPLSEHSGINVELKGVLLFPSSGMSVALQAGYNHGF
jgi:hypothetical protein